MDDNLQVRLEKLERSWRAWGAFRVLLVGFALVILAMFLNRKSFSPLPFGTVVVVGVTLMGVWLGVLGASYQAKKKKTLFKELLPKNQPTGDMMGMGPGGMPMEMSNLLTPEMQQSKEVQRLCNVVYNADDTLLPVPDKFEFEDGKLVSYAFESTQPGHFTRNTYTDRVFNTLRTAIGTGWTIEFDEVEDMVSGTKKQAIPKLAFPDMWHVVQSEKEAAAFFPKFNVAIGLGEFGPITINPANVPHRFLVGATGGGKSVAMRAELMQYLAAGYRMFALDGKGTDYAAFARFPNVSAVSTELPEHVILVHTVWQILKDRQRDAKIRSKKGDMSWRSEYAPVVLVIDEFASVRTNMATEYKAQDIKNFDRDIVDILKVGREFRVNVLLATQDMKAETVKTDWLAMFKVTQSLGKPDGMTVNKAFPEESRAQVTRIGQQISPNDRGRALAAVTDKSGRIAVQLYQAYWSYSPAEDINDVPEPAQENWPKFKAAVADRIPRMYPRVWVRMEYPESVKNKAEGYVDLSEFTIEELQQLKPIRLEDPETFAPIPEHMVYDPLRDEYMGNAPLDAIENLEV